MKRSLLVVLMLLPVLASADMRIGVVDPIGALQEADEFKTRYSKLESSLQGDQARLEQLGKEVEGLRNRLDKEGMTMGEDERQRLQTQGQQKMIEVQNLRQSAQKKLGRGQQEILDVMEPKLREAVEAVAKKRNLDMVLNGQAVVYLKGDEPDITKDVTQQLNRMK